MCPRFSSVLFLQSTCCKAPRTRNQSTVLTKLRLWWRMEPKSDQDTWSRTAAWLFLRPSLPMGLQCPPAAITLGWQQAPTPCTLSKACLPMRPILMRYINNLAPKVTSSYLFKIQLKWFTYLNIYTCRWKNICDTASKNRFLFFFYFKVFQCYQPNPVASHLNGGLFSPNMFCQVGELEYALFVQNISTFTVNPQINAIIRGALFKNFFFFLISVSD